MLSNCADACRRVASAPGGVAGSFYELSARTAAGASLDFGSLRDTVVLVTNVASE